jgi:hypothetical protein
VHIRLLAIGLIAGLLAACTSGAADPKPTPSTLTEPITSAQTSPTPTRTGPLTTGPNVRPGETPPEYPALARQHTANGALAFAAYYFRAFDWSYATNDAYLLRGLALPTCKGCKSSISAISGLAEEQGVLLGGRISFRSARIVHRQFDFDAEFVVDVGLDEEAVVLRLPSQAPSTAAAAVVGHHALLFVRWVGEHWQVADVTAR